VTAHSYRGWSPYIRATRDVIRHYVEVQVRAAEERVEFVRHARRGKP
jgi:hypothetical protein